jgi:hypothetical protein
MIYAIDTDGRTVATTNDADMVARLNTEQVLRETLRHVKTTSGKLLWNGRSEFTVRVASDAECEDYRRREAIHHGRAC